MGGQAPEGSCGPGGVGGGCGPGGAGGRGPGWGGRAGPERSCSPGGAARCPLEAGLAPCAHGRWCCGSAASSRSTWETEGSGCQASGGGGGHRGRWAWSLWPPSHHLHPVLSTMASPTATSPATEYSSDPRVSVGRSVGRGPPPALPSTERSLSAGVNTGAVGSYIYDKDPEGKAQP